MDAAVNYFDSRNPPSGPNNPLAETDPTAAVQNFVVPTRRLTAQQPRKPARCYGTPPVSAPVRPPQLVLNDIRIGSPATKRHLQPLALYPDARHDVPERFRDTWWPTSTWFEGGRRANTDRRDRHGAWSSTATAA